jgi:hypothetical protein
MKHIILPLLLAPAIAAADAPPRALVVHVPPLATEPGRAIELEAMLDAPIATTLAARWRAAGASEWADVAFERSSAGGWFASLPGEPGGVEYYLVSKPAMGGTEVAHFASADAPHVVRVDATLMDRLETLDDARLQGRRNQVAIEVTGHNFGNRYDLDDRFLRAEAAYTHRFLRTLHQITFGFGSISGTTPIVSEPMGDTDGHALRYGFGEIRIRAHRSVFLDARASLGASHEGFDQGVRGQVHFGKPWRSSLAIGGEYLGDLGGTGWVRLQWDTAPPFLMAASIVRTDLPGAVIDQAGLFLGYDVAYTVADRFTVKANLSYGSRDGAANFGGGFGTAIDF